MGGSEATQNGVGTAHFPDDHVNVVGRDRVFEAILMSPKSEKNE